MKEVAKKLVAFHFNLSLTQGGLSQDVGDLCTKDYYKEETVLTPHYVYEKELFQVFLTKI